MNEILIRASFKIVCPLLGLISFYFFFRGHNSPGGGFIGGLLFSLSLILKILSNPNSRAEEWIKKHFSKSMALVILGLAIVGLFPVLFGKAILSGLWSSIPLPIAGKISSILFFDFLIFLLVALCTTRAYIEFTDFTGKGRLS